jgi:hypothetical protein
LFVLSTQLVNLRIRLQAAATFAELRARIGTRNQTGRGSVGGSGGGSVGGSEGEDEEEKEEDEEAPPAGSLCFSTVVQDLVLKMRVRTPERNPNITARH